MQLLRWQVESDPDATRERYARITSVGVDSCSCDGCRNFRALRDQDFPPGFLTLLSQLGIPLRKPVEVTSYGPEKSSLHIYQLLYHFAGRLTQGRDGWKQVSPGGWTADFEPLEQNAAVGLTTRLALVPESFKDVDIVQIDFDLRLPWVLDEPYQDTAT